MAHFKHRGKELTVGPGFQTRVNALIGASSPSDVGRQKRKIDTIAQSCSKPDIITDLSIIRSRDKPLWKHILSSTDLIVGTLPIYTVQRRSIGIDPKELLETTIEHMEQGVRLVTIHPTASKEIIDAASHRLVPITSRGGGMVIRDLLTTGKATNVYLQILPELVACASKTGTVLSLGATFRSATIFDSCDIAQTKEIELQLKLANEISEAGANAIIEDPGHARPRDITHFADILRPSGRAVMPLGPIPTDSAIGVDHVSAAIGATLLGLAGCAHVLAAVTREEHTGGVPSIASTIEAIEAARVAARIIDLELLNEDTLDRAIAEERSIRRSCVIGKSSKGCARCAAYCPL